MTDLVVILLVSPLLIWWMVVLWIASGAPDAPPTVRRWLGK